MRKEAVMGWQSARDSWGMKCGGGTEGLWGGRNEAGETRSKLRCAPDSGLERQVRRNGFPVKTHFSTWR